MALTSVFYDGVVTETDRAKNRAGRRHTASMALVTSR
ncbi:hypothetical protein AHiyo6_05180 [Arthrobacter sp. Hiyo6]|nr:hypothetical protein AHiyo6_05180 [Arthrobacter sp. Hiyo6]